MLVKNSRFQPPPSHTSNYIHQGSSQKVCTIKIWQSSSKRFMFATPTKCCPPAAAPLNMRPVTVELLICFALQAVSLLSFQFYQKSTISFNLSSFRCWLRSPFRTHFWPALFLQLKSHLSEAKKKYQKRSRASDIVGLSVSQIISPLHHFSPGWILRDILSASVLTISYAPCPLETDHHGEKSSTGTPKHKKTPFSQPRLISH